MALLTELSAEAMGDLVRPYGLNLRSLTPLALGSVNSNFFLEAVRDGQSESVSYFARIFEEQGLQGARFELLLNRALHQEGLPVARPVMRLDGELAGLHLGKPFALYERLSGTVVCQKRVTVEIAGSVGRMLARVHSAQLGDIGLPESRFDFAGLTDRLDLVRASGRPDLRPAADLIQVHLVELQARRSSDLPQGLIHGDLFRDNVLIGGGEVVGLLDFESASRGPFVFDLMVTLLAWCFGDALDHALVRAMVQGYQSVRPLTAGEVAEMVTEGSIACVRFATTRLTDFSLRVAAGDRPLRDYRRFLERLSALTSGELAVALSGRS